MSGPVPSPQGWTRAWAPGSTGRRPPGGGLGAASGAGSPDRMSSGGGVGGRLIGLEVVRTGQRDTLLIARRGVGELEPAKIPGPAGRRSLRRRPPDPVPAALVVQLDAQ